MDTEKYFQEKVAQINNIFNEVGAADIDGNAKIEFLAYLSALVDVLWERGLKGLQKEELKEAEEVKMLHSKDIHDSMKDVITYSKPNN